jgi:uncharacterized surface protein with fasciclin (FAS1) repeats
LNALFCAVLLLPIAGCAAPTPERAGPAAATVPQANPTVGGSVMDPALTLVRNAANSKQHTTFTSAVRAAGLESTLGNAGSFTVFAPTDEAFARLPNGTITSLMDPSNKSLLGRLLRYHVVPGAKTRSQIAADAKAGGGVVTYSTVEGTPIRVLMAGNRILVADIHGNRSEVRIADVRNSNGVMHVIDGVLLPTT